jgi:hypothetical protein
LLVKIPLPDPSNVLAADGTVGFVEVLQHTPLVDTVAPPSEVIFPPLTAEVKVIPDTEVVVTDGIDAVAFVVTVISCPYAVPIEFVA